MDNKKQKNMKPETTNTEAITNTKNMKENSTLQKNIDRTLEKYGDALKRLSK